VAVTKKSWLYIDGYNFYYSIKKQPTLPLAWCDFRKLAVNHLLRKDSRLTRIKYLTAPVGRFESSLGERKRQSLWLKAVKSIDGLEVIEGYHTKHEGKLREEKQTDVNIAVHLLLDAHEECYDNAIVITGDTDLIQAIDAVCNRASFHRPVDVWIPPGDAYHRWKRFANRHGVDCKQVELEMLAASRLPDKFEHNGEVIEALNIWRMPKGLDALRWISRQRS